jgi:hypothetical protein
VEVKATLSRSWPVVAGAVIRTSGGEPQAASATLTCALASANWPAES